MKRLSVILLIVLLLFVAVFAFQSKWYIKNARYSIDDATEDTLQKLGTAALQSEDVPVAAIILYNDHILGAGFNTVKRDSAAGGHAEINAISSVMRRIGYDSLMHLRGDALTLITTWEPCAMCRGAIMEYNIRHVVVLQMKPMPERVRQWMPGLKYEWNKQATTKDTLQEALFRKHPLYLREKAKGNW